MPRIRLKEDHELSALTLSRVQSVEAAGGDTSSLRGLAHIEKLFAGFNQWYIPARKGDSVEEELIELVRLKIARLNDCYT